MRINQNNGRGYRPASAFSIAETMVAVAIFGIMFASFFGGLSLSLSIVQSARENLRATQIMTEQMDVIRLGLTRFDDLKDTNYTLPFNPLAKLVTNSGSAGLTYTVRVVVPKTSPITTGETYSNNVKQVTIQLTWKSKKTVKTNEMTTFVSRYGMQNYIFGN